MQHTHTHTHIILFYIILSLICFGSDSAFIRKVKLKGLPMVYTGAEKLHAQTS